MKRIFILFLLLILCICLWACATTSSKSIIEYPLKEVNIIYDKNNNVLQQTLYNEVTNEFITTFFRYEYINGFWTCVDQKLFILLMALKVTMTKVL